MLANAVCLALKTFSCKITAFDADSPMAFHEHKMGTDEKMSKARRDRRKPWG
jgi:hypothetical protein